MTSVVAEINIDGFVIALHESIYGRLSAQGIISTNVIASMRKC
ncbi:MAG: hypothetical protein ACTS6P_00900 [Candidatus Hodgkinia cicadicola]